MIAFSSDHEDRHNAPAPTADFKKTLQAVKRDLVSADSAEKQRVASAESCDMNRGASAFLIRLFAFAAVQERSSPVSGGSERWWRGGIRRWLRMGRVIGDAPAPGCA